MSETERAGGHPTALFRACDLSVRINHDLDLLPRRQPARRGPPAEHLKPFGLVIAIRHPPRQARDRVAAAADRTSRVSGKSASVRVVLGVRRIIRNYN